MSETPITFQSMGLLPAIQQSLDEVGYEQPTPIQASCIPALLDGKDIIGLAQTGTGKTAAFALPLLSKIDINNRSPQMLVLAPTRELAIQVSEALQKYAKHMKGFHVLPIYGGQSYDIQLRSLKRGVHVVVGTPGRIMDHIKRKTLQLSGITKLVLDEADEMLRMGFIEDIEWIMSHVPKERQVALFSATMPAVIRKVAKNYMNSPTEINIASKTATADTIRQRYWATNQNNKLESLTRLLEFEPTDAVLIFVRTKTATVELAEKLEARGHACEALNGDIQQKMRERVIDKLKKGQLDIVVATDVAARGLDVQRISHVINYDVPHDTESYIHRIGRTGRAGKSGEAILFITPRERRMLRQIEKATRKPIEELEMPSIVDINNQRVARFKDSISTEIRLDKSDPYHKVIEEFMNDNGIEPLDVAAALARIIHKNDDLFLPDIPMVKPKQSKEKNTDRKGKDRPGRERGDRNERGPKANRNNSKSFDEADIGTAIPLKDYPKIEMDRFRLDVGYQHKVKPGNIVGAIANEADIESCYIGHIEIYEEFTTVDLPAGMPKDTLQTLRKARICGLKSNITKI